MTKDELINTIAAKADLSKVTAGKALKATLDGISAALAEGEKVSFVGFGTFMVQHRKPRKGRNPRTRTAIEIPATKVPRFKPGKALKDAVR